MSNYKQKTKSDLLKFYIKAKYPTTNVVVLHYSTTITTGDWLSAATAIDEEYEYDSEDYLLLIYEDIEEALEVCDSVPNSRPYTMVFENGECVSENT